KREAERHTIWGYDVAGELAGKLHIIPLSVLIDGKAVRMGGISSVATWPEYRRQGIAKQLLIHALKEMTRAGQIISYLHPFHVGCYRKYGWELSFVRHLCTIPIGQLNDRWQGKGYVRRKMDALSTLQTIYESYMQN